MALSVSTETERGSCRGTERAGGIAQYSRSELIEEMLMQQLAALRSQASFKFPLSCSTVCSPARLLIRKTACSAMIAFIRGQFSTPFQ